MHYPVRPLIALALIAMIAIWHTVPAGCEHAHTLASTGEAALCGEHEVHAHCHHEHGSTDGHQHAESHMQADGIAEVQLHTHVTWLGLQFVLVGGAGQDAPPASNDGHHAVLLLDDAPQRADLPQIEIPQSHDLIVGWTIVDDSPANQTEAHAHDLAERCLAAHSLCDTARHERSGVQLF